MAWLRYQELREHRSRPTEGAISCVTQHSKTIQYLAYVADGNIILSEGQLHKLVHVLLQKGCGSGLDGGLWSLPDSAWHWCQNFELKERIANDSMFHSHLSVLPDNKCPFSNIVSLVCLRKGDVFAFHTWENSLTKFEWFQHISCS